MPSKRKIETPIIVLRFIVCGLLYKNEHFYYLCCMLLARDYITIDKEILGGQPVFKGTRVPIETLFDHLESGISLDEFLEDFPGVSKDQAIAVLEVAGKLLASGNLFNILDAAA